MCPFTFEIPYFCIQLQGSLTFLLSESLWHLRSFQVDEWFPCIEGCEHGIEEHAPAYLVEGVYQPVPVAVGIV